MDVCSPFFFSFLVFSLKNLKLGAFTSVVHRLLKNVFISGHDLPPLHYHTVSHQFERMQLYEFCYWRADAYNLQCSLLVQDALD